MSAGDAYETQYLLAAFSTGHFSGFPSTYYLAMFTAAPSDSGGGTECTIGTGGYARVGIANTDANWTVAAGVAKNTNAITFPTATANWMASANITHWALMSAATAGAIVHWGAWTTPAPVLSGETPVVSALQLVISAD